MFQSKIPTNLWCYAIKHVVFLINPIPSPDISNKTPFDLLYKEQPNFSSLKIFGCLCFASTNIPHYKFEARSRKWAFLGFFNGTKDYVILDVNAKEIVISRDVIFHELILPFHITPINPNQHSPPLPNNSITDLLNKPPSPSIPANTPYVPFETTSLSSPLPNSLSSHVSNPPFNEPFLHSPSTTSPPSSNESPISHQPPSPRRSTHETHPPSYLSDYQYKLPSIKSAQLSSTCSYPIQACLSYARISPSHHHYLMALSSDEEPTSFHEASKHQCWRDAMQCEIEALQSNHTWDVVPTPPSFYSHSTIQPWI